MPIPAMHIVRGDIEWFCGKPIVDKFSTAYPRTATCLSCLYWYSFNHERLISIGTRTARDYVHLTMPGPVLAIQCLLSLNKGIAYRFEYFFGSQVNCPSCVYAYRQDQFDHGLTTATASLQEKIDNAINGLTRRTAPWAF